jgi:hypothetical protein
MEESEFPEVTLPYCIMWAIAGFVFVGAYLFGVCAMSAIFPRCTPAWYWFPIIFAAGACGVSIVLMAAALYDYERGQ